MNSQTHTPRKQIVGSQNQFYKAIHRPTNKRNMYMYKLLYLFSELFEKILLSE